MRRVRNKIGLLVVMIVAVSMIISAVPAQAAVKWAFSTSNGKKKASVNDTITMEKGEYQDMNLYRNSKQIKESDATYKVSWYTSDKNVVYVDKASGRMKADKFGQMTSDNGTAKITAVIKNKQTGTMTKKSFTVKVGSEKVALPSGIRELEFSDSSIKIVSINGGVVIAEKDGLYGAMNTKGEVIVPYEYTGVTHKPTEKGYFILYDANSGWGGKATIFDRTGTAIKSIFEWYSSIQIEGDMAFWAEDMYGYCWQDLLNKNGGDGNNGIEGYYYGGYGYTLFKAAGSVLQSRPIYNNEDYKAEFVTIMDLNGKEKNSSGQILAEYLGVLELDSYKVHSSYGENIVVMFGEDTIGILDVSSGIRDGVTEDAAKGETTFALKLIKASQVLEKYTDFDVEKDGEAVEWTYGCWGTLDDGETKYSIDEQMAMYLDVAGERVTFLLNFKNAVVDENGYVTNLDDVIVGQGYDVIGISDTGYHYAETENEEVFIDGNGKVVASYKDVSSFIEAGYAVVIKEDGLAYLVDTELNEIPTGFKAELVGGVGEALVIVENGNYHYFIAE